MKHAASLMARMKLGVATASDRGLRGERSRLVRVAVLFSLAPVQLGRDLAPVQLGRLLTFVCEGSLIVVRAAVVVCEAAVVVVRVGGLVVVRGGGAAAAACTNLLVRRRRRRVAADDGALLHNRIAARLSGIRRRPEFRFQCCAVEI